MVQFMPEKDRDKERERESGPFKYVYSNLFSHSTHAWHEQITELPGSGLHHWNIKRSVELWLEI